MSMLPFSMRASKEFYFLLERGKYVLLSWRWYQISRIWTFYRLEKFFVSVIAILQNLTPFFIVFVFEQSIHAPQSVKYNIITCTDISPHRKNFCNGYHQPFSRNITP